MDDQQTGMAVVSLSGNYLLTVEQANAILSIIIHGEKVEWDWNTKQYKYRKPEQEGLGSLTLLSAVQVATMALEQ